MKRRFQSFLGVAAMLGIGGAMAELTSARERTREDRVMPATDERIERIKARSKDDQERKRARRKARWDKSQKGRK